MNGLTDEELFEFYRLSINHYEGIVNGVIEPILYGEVIEPCNCPKEMLEHWKKGAAELLDEGDRAKKQAQKLRKKIEDLQE
jgi:hypothetical protein